MPNKEVHLIFDNYLKREGLISTEVDFSLIHDWLVAGFREQDTHQLKDFNLDVFDIQEWILEISKTTDDKNTLTDYLRVALGHLVLDLLYSNFSFENEYQMVKRAIDVYLDRKYDTCFFELSGTLNNL
jgi:hypothetical protein